MLLPGRPGGRHGHAAPAGYEGYDNPNAHPAAAMFLCPLHAVRGMATVQVTDQFSAILAELFADAPYVSKLGYDVSGTSVIVRAVFDDNDVADYSKRLDEVGDRFTAFEHRVIDGIMPEMDLRMQAAPSRRGWPDGLAGMAVVIDR